MKGGVGGIGKSARYYLREIQDGKMTFHAAFNGKDGQFIIAREGGKKLIKTGLYRYRYNTRRLFQDCSLVFLVHLKVRQGDKPWHPKDHEGTQ